VHRRLMAARAYRRPWHLQVDAQGHCGRSISCSKGSTLTFTGSVLCDWSWWRLWLAR